MEFSGKINKFICEALRAESIVHSNLENLAHFSLDILIQFERLSALLYVLQGYDSSCQIKDNFQS